MVGGGAVAERKALGLLSAGALVTVVSPRATKGLSRLAKEGQIRLLKKGFSPGDLEGFFLVMAAAGSREVNEAAWDGARTRGQLVNVADDPQRCSFILPAVVDRGPLVVAISTSGRSPALARALREELEEAIGGEYETFVEILGAARKKLLKSSPGRDKKESIIKDLVASPLPGLIRAKDVRGVNRVLMSILGKGNSLSRLGIKIKGR